MIILISWRKLCLILRVHNVIWILKYLNISVYIAYIMIFIQGILDIILTTYSKDKKYHTHLLEQEFSEDANFLKIMGNLNTIIYLIQSNGYQTD